ncbi:MAG TPA: AAA family ATPase [Methylophilaceae bacterium]|nr:AAA family ATPase [Methylophilaceae bacterium]
MINIKVENCRNIKKAEVTLIPDQLNIRYAMNGTGKTTIATVIEFLTQGKNLTDLKTFGSDIEPACVIEPNLGKVFIFDEKFLSTIVFQESEVITDAFEIFIKTPEYDGKQKLINERLKSMNIDISENPEYGILVTTGEAVLSKFTMTAGNEFKKTGLIKSLISSESIYQLPEKLKKFQPMMNKDYNVEWVGWKSDGAKYDDNEICPFCTEEIGEVYTEEKKLFSESYSKSNVKNIREMLGYFETVAEYMLPEKHEAMSKCIKESVDEETITKWVKDFYQDLDFLVKKIRKVVGFNAYHIKQEEISTLADKLNELLIDPDALTLFKSKKTLDLVGLLNNEIKKVASEVDKLKVEIGTLKGNISASLHAAVSDINEFLDMSDINYVLEIQHLSVTETKTLLRYKPHGKDSVAVNDIRKSLSWGERNAFALILFMHYAQSKNPDLIILDDPISSFDTNKKYAIISRLFINEKTKKSLYKKTTLMLTHDFQPVIDFIVNNKPNGGNSNAAFLRNDNGVISQTTIQKSDIRPFALLLLENCTNNDLNKIHRVTCLRKLLEHTKPNEIINLEYNLISSLLKVKNIPSYADETPMSPEEIEAAEKGIRIYIEDFKYETFLAETLNQETLVKLYQEEPIDYFKLQIFRILLGINDLRSKISDPLLKYIDEQFHVENDYVFYLDYAKYNTVPSYILPKCNSFLQNEKVIPVVA